MIKQTSDYRQHLYSTLFESNVQKIRATLLVLHGMEEHSGRYEEFSKHLANQGFAVLTYDHLGHGKTAKNKKDLGFFSKNNSVERVVDDARTMANYLEKMYPDVPHFILGHSMGSFITRCLLQEESNRFDGAVIVGTGGKLKGVKPGKIYFSILNIFTPKKRSRFINNTFNKINNRRFKDDDKDSIGMNWLSVNKSNRKAFLNDSLCGVPFTNNGFYTLISLNIRATKRDWAKNIRKKLPFLFISGSDDPIGNFGKGVEKTAELLKKDGFKDVSMKLYPKMRHEILNEDIKEHVYKDIVQWLTKYSKMSTLK
ncbi:MAG: alpha/beta fold hydrolase [Flavobacteriales bacterium]